MEAGGNVNLLEDHGLSAVMCGDGVFGLSQEAVGERVGVGAGAAVVDVYREDPWFYAAQPWTAAPAAAFQPVGTGQFNVVADFPLRAPGTVGDGADYKVAAALQWFPD